MNDFTSELVSLWDKLDAIEECLEKCLPIDIPLTDNETETLINVKAKLCILADIMEEML